MTSRFRKNPMATLNENCLNCIYIISTYIYYIYIYPRQGKCRLHKHGCIILMIFFLNTLCFYIYIFFLTTKGMYLSRHFSSFVNVISLSLCVIILVTVTGSM